MPITSRALPGPDRAIEAPRHATRTAAFTPVPASRWLAVADRAQAAAAAAVRRCQPAGCRGGGHRSIYDSAGYAAVCELAADAPIHLAACRHRARHGHDVSERSELTGWPSSAGHGGAERSEAAT
jgi:hypothetical protein